MTTIYEIAPDLFRISVFIPALDLQFNHFLVRDAEPLLFAAGMRAFFPALREAVGLLLDPAQLRWIAFSHFEADECGALNDWLELAPAATAVCGSACATVNVDDWALRPARGLANRELLATGRARFRFLATPHLPHTWDAGMLFEETSRTLLCSDLFFQHGNTAPLTDDLAGAAALALRRRADKSVCRQAAARQRGAAAARATLAELDPRVIAVGHGASFRGDGGVALRRLGAAAAA